MDTELVDSTKVDIAGNEAKLVVKGERSTLLWKDEPFILMVTGDMNSDELIQVAKGITERQNKLKKFLKLLSHNCFFIRHNI